MLRGCARCIIPDEKGARRTGVRVAVAEAFVRDGLCGRENRWTVYMFTFECRR